MKVGVKSGVEENGQIRGYKRYKSREVYPGVK